ncbi:hypothetical protein KC19_8G196600 [Ceratodon purpureus]|uniref:ABC-2 type transporter transmembrane domain-containing protein n=1 Tax=Ceratodon purpureus TaxID=3225 RepID=A0A8T0H5D5_CERPU|nr:hypothetical protein KC19_8G196600 [Ceratodon purpureus]
MCDSCRNMTSGFMIPKNKIPTFWMWLYWVNPTQYALNSLTAIAFHCDLEAPLCQSCDILNPASCPECPCVRVSDQGNILAWFIMKDLMSLNYGDRYQSMGMLFLFICIFMVASVIALKYMKYNQR